MKQSTFTAGDTVYLENGQLAEFVATLPDGVVIRPIYESEDDSEPHYGKTRTASRIYAEPPTAKFSAEVLALGEQAATLRAEIAVLRDNRKAEEGLRARLAKQPSLLRIDDFLAGRITHVVLNDYSGPEVKTLEDALRPDKGDGGHGKLRLLHLYGDADRNVHWGLDRYTYGPGGHETWMLPCLSLDEARAKALEVIEERFSKWRADPNQHHGMQYFVERLQQLGEPVPADVAAHLHASKVSVATSKLTAAEKSAAEARAELGRLAEVQGAAA